MPSACAAPSSLNETHGAWFNTYLRHSPQQSGGGRDSDLLTGEAAQILVHKYFLNIGVQPVPIKPMTSH